MSDLAKYIKKQDRATRNETGERLEFDKLVTGKNYRRFLPRKDSDLFCLEIRKHTFYDKDGKLIIASCLTPVDEFDDYSNPPEYTECPICLGFIAEMERIIAKHATKDDPYASKTKEAKDEKKTCRETYGAKQRFISFVTNPKAETVEDRKKVKILEYGGDTFNPLLSLRRDEEECGDFTDLTTGREILIVKTVKGKQISDTSYSIQKAESGKRPLADSEEIFLQVPDEASSVLFKFTADRLLRVFNHEEAAYEKHPPQEPESIPPPTEEHPTAKPVEKVSPTPVKPSPLPAKPVATATLAKEALPGCFQSAEDHDPNDDICKACPLFIRCGEAPEVRAKVDLLNKKPLPKSIQDTKAQLAALAAKKR